MPIVRKPFVLALYGTSLTQGRLNAEWPAFLTRELQQYPEAKGPIVIYNQGRGSQNSDWGLANIGLIADQRPSHVLMEGFSINDAAVTGGNPAVTIANHDANVTAMVAAIRAARADADITIQTMNPVSAVGVALRPNLAAYYARDVALAGTLGLTLLDNYGGVAGGPIGGWPKPLDQRLTANVGPPGFTEWDVGDLARWNGADKNALITLSNGDRTATGAVGAANAAVRATLSRQVGKFVFTVRADAVAGGGVGFGRAATSLNTYPGNDPNSAGIRFDGQIWNGGAYTGVSTPPIVAGDLVGWAMDFDKGLYWAHVNGSYYGAAGAPVVDPVSGQGGLVGSINNAFFPIVAASAGGAWTSQFELPAPGDGLHPIFPGAVGTYLYPNVIALLRAKMAAYWPN